MEVYAGFVEQTDHEVGRLVDEIDNLGYGDNTLILYIWGDNGASAEGLNGTISELLAQNGIPSTTDQHIKALNALGGLDVLGSPKTDNMYHAGWAWAGGAPYKGTKLLASHFGGTRDPMRALRWPVRADQARPHAALPQFHHVNDIALTIYEILGITPPRTVNVASRRIPSTASVWPTRSTTRRRRTASTPSISRSWAAAPFITTGWIASTAFGPPRAVEVGHATGHP